MLVSSSFVFPTCEFTFHVLLEDGMKQKAQSFTEQHLVVFPTVTRGEYRSSWSHQIQEDGSKGRQFSDRRCVEIKSHVCLC